MTTTFNVFPRLYVKSRKIEYICQLKNNINVEVQVILLKVFI
jgi:hypothetical protein